MLVDTPEMEKATSKRSSAFFESFDIGEGLDTRKSGQESRVSAILRSDNGGRNKPSSRENGVDHSPSHSLGSAHSRNYSRPSGGDRPSPSEQLPQPSYSTPEVRTDSNSPGHSVARADIKASAEKILYTFVLPGSEREIVLPDSMLNKIIRAIEEEGRDDPEVFDDAKDYVFQAMERDAFPGFLQAKALGNLVPLSVLIRLIIGLTSLMAGFWGGYYMILRNESRRTRCWVSLFPVVCVPFIADPAVSKAHPTVRHRHVFPRVLPVQARHPGGVSGLFRVYLDELVQGQGAVCASVAVDSRHDGVLDVRGDGGCVERAVHFCARDELLSLRPALDEQRCEVILSHCDDRDELQYFLRDDGHGHGHGLGWDGMDLGLSLGNSLMQNGKRGEARQGEMQRVSSWASSWAAE